MLAEPWGPGPVFIHWIRTFINQIRILDPKNHGIHCIGMYKNIGYIKGSDILGRKGFYLFKLLSRGWKRGSGYIYKLNFYGQRRIQNFRQWVVEKLYKGIDIVYYNNYFWGKISNYNAVHHQHLMLAYQIIVFAFKMALQRIFYAKKFWLPQSH